MGLDLNLLVSLDALLQERSVTRAARRLGLSQPTLSTALARLRRHFGDDLLARVGNSYELTPLGERLAENTAVALTWTDRVFQTRPDFDPEHSEHEFTLVVADCHLPLFCRVLTDLVRRHAPNMRLKFRHSTTQFVQRASERLRSVDAVVCPDGVEDMPTMHLYRDRWVFVMSADLADRPLSTADLSRRQWVLAYEHPFSNVSPMPRLQAEGVQVRSVITTEHFMPIPDLVAGTDLIGLMPERLARLRSRDGSVRVVEPPFPVGFLVESMSWHPVQERQPAHVWLRGMASRAGQLIEEGV